MISVRVEKHSGDWQISCDGLRAPCNTRSYTTREAALDRMVLHTKWDHASDNVVITIEGE